MADLGVNPVYPLPKRTPVGTVDPMLIQRMNQLSQEGAADRKALQDSTAAEIKQTETMMQNAEKSRQEGAARVDALEAKADSENQLKPFSYTPKDMSDYTGMMMVFAALGGALTRAPMTAAMNNLAAGIRGLAEGRKQDFEEHYQAYKENLDLALAKHRDYQDRLNAIKEQNKGDYQAQIDNIKLLQLEYGWQRENWRDQLKSREDEIKNMYEQALVQNNAARTLIQLRGEIDRKIAAMRAANDRETAHADKQAADAAKAAAANKAKWNAEKNKIGQLLATGKIDKKAAATLNADADARYGMQGTPAAAGGAPSADPLGLFKNR